MRIHTRLKLSALTSSSVLAVALLASRVPSANFAETFCTPNERPANAAMCDALEAFELLDSQCRTEHETDLEATQCLVESGTASLRDDSDD
jgi:hypothetical protein